MVKKIYLVAILVFVLVSINSLAEDFLPAIIQGGQEVFHLGYKHSNHSNYIISTEPYISCSWKPDSIDNGWKKCEAVFEIKNQNEVKLILTNPKIQFIFEKNNIKNQVVSYSSRFNLVNKTYTEIITQKDEKGNLEAVEQAHLFTKKQFYGFTTIPSQIDTSQPFAIKITYEAPKYSDNQFNLTISDQNFLVYIDPDQSTCGTLTAAGTYTLNQSVSSAGTCFVVNASDLILDCHDYLINYSTNGTLGYGIENSGFGNVTIQNCQIQEGSNQTVYKHGIYYNNAANGTILNNTLHMIGGLGNGIFLTTLSDYTNLINNNVTTDGSTSYAIRLLNSSFCSLSNNTVTTNTAGAVGIELRTASNSNVLNSNTIITGGTGGYGIYLRMNSSDNTLLNNYLSASYPNTPEIYDLTGDGYLNYLVYNNSYGEIRWSDTSDFLKDIDVDEEIGLGSNLFIGNNTAALNTSAFTNSKINSSANITLKGFDFNTINETKRLESYSTNSSEILNNGVNCLGTSCQVLSYSQGILVFNTTSFSSFAAAGSLEVDVYNTSLLFTNSSHYSAFRFFMKNIVFYTNLFNWTFDTQEDTIQSTLTTNLTPNENLFVFIEYDYTNAGVKTVVANGTTTNDIDSEEIDVTIE